MAIGREQSAYSRTFGDRAQTQGGTNNGQSKRPDANLYLNIGYEVEVDGEKGRETKFVSLPLGTGLDNQTPNKTNTNSPELNQLLQAGNALMDSLVALGFDKLAPGETMIVPLQIQLRRVKDKEEVSKTSDGNPFVMDFSKMFGNKAA